MVFLIFGSDVPTVYISLA